MEITTTIKDAPDKTGMLGKPPETLVHITIEERQQQKEKKDDLLERIMNFEPIDVGEKDIVETIREERERLDTRNLKKVSG